MVPVQRAKIGTRVCRHRLMANPRPEVAGQFSRLWSSGGCRVVWTDWHGYSVGRRSRLPYQSVKPDDNDDVSHDFQQRGESYVTLKPLIDGRW